MPFWVCSRLSAVKPRLYCARSRCAITDMAAEIKKEIELEIAHVLFTDIVGYSKLPIHQQRALVERLNEIVRGTDEFQAAESAGRLITIPTGDGITLVFYHNPEAPVECALEISRALKEYPELQLRMGIHSGPVSGIIDATGKANVAGAGINIAQRVMDCGDAGHILLSKHVAEDLEEYPHWQPYLHELGECEVKHGVRLSVVNLYTAELGNPAVPEKLTAERVAAVAQRKRAAFRRLLLDVVSLLAVIALIGFLLFRYKRPPATGELLVSEKSIAVLPFDNRSRDPDNAYFADGIQDEILTRLSKIADLKVISRTSTQRYQSKPGNLSEIARQLGVGNILEGSVQRVGDQVRVNVQLVNAQSDSHLWAETYDRKLTDILGVESEIAKGIAESLRAKLTGEEEQVIAAKPTNNPEAYDAYLRGLASEAREKSRAQPSFSEEAPGFYERAVQLDPNFALAWARLSRANAVIYFNLREAVRRDAAKRALENAQKLEPNSPETLLALGYYQYWVLRDYGPAKTTFERVSKMLPGNSEVPRALGLIARREGNWDQSIAYYEQALVLDPRNIELLMDAAWTYTMLREFPAALKLYDRALDIKPNDPDIMAAKASIYQAQGNLQEAARLLSQISAQTPSEDTVLIKINQLRLERNYSEALGLLQARLAQFHYDSQDPKSYDQVGLALLQHLAGDTAGARVTAEQVRNTVDQLYRDQLDNVSRAMRAAKLSQAYAATGQKDSALEAAERAIILYPRAEDAVSGPYFEEGLAVVQTSCGENNRAIATLTQLLQTPYKSWVYVLPPITSALLRLDPFWDPLRSDPAFQKLCEEKQP
jgi:TolB-like protein/class 3 adenylate cyclase/cytochrome c-type biogenesis protein CcmH/NrfG